MAMTGSGRVRVEAVVELRSPFMDIRQMLPDLTSDVLDANRDWLRRDLLGADDVAHLVFQSFIVTTPGRRILIDSCIGNEKNNARPLFHRRRSDAYMRALKAAGLTPDDIDVVLCTHLHPDHVGWNTRLENGRWVPTFPKARYVFGRAEHDHWAARHAAAPVSVYAESVLPIVEAGRAELVGDDFTLDETLRLLPTPGHTPGHVAVSFGAGDDEVVFTGDLLHSPLQLRHPELSVSFDADMAQAAVTRRAFLEAFCDRPATCCFGHFPMAMNGRIQRWDSGFRCEPAG